MNITSQELTALGFRRAGTVYPDANTKVRIHIDWDAPGFVVYIMVVDNQFKKAGTTGRKNSSFKSRMSSTFSALRRVIIGGPPYIGDPFKQNAPAAILDNKQVELWAREYPSFESMLAKETELNLQFRPHWTKEGEVGGSSRAAS